MQPSSDKAIEEPSTSTSLIDTNTEGITKPAIENNVNEDLAGLLLDCDMPTNFGSFMPSQLLQVMYFFF